MTQNKKIALTGGIGSGKSTACSLLREMGYTVFSCDEIYDALSREKEYLALLEKSFPDCVFEGMMDRKRLSQKVFSDLDAMQTLNQLSHPLVYQRLFNQMEKYSLSFAEVPLLFESGKVSEFDKIIVISRNESERIRAVKARSQLTENEIIARMKNQFNYTSLPKDCIVIENNGTIIELREKLRRATLTF